MPLAEEYGAFFLIGIGLDLADGKPHERAAITTIGVPHRRRRRGLNAISSSWNKRSQQASRSSSMGIRVDKAALELQLAKKGQEARKELYFHKRLLQGSLPLCIGGGIGQSRLCMYILRKAHIGEIQVGLWPEEMRTECKKAGINLL